jgi:hypothetical protein
MVTMNSTRRWFLASAGLAVVAAGGALWFGGASARPALDVFKSATCTCCAAWVTHVQEHGFAAKVVILDEEALAAKKRALGVPDALTSCHTALMAGYVLEGHIPAPALLKLLGERPAGLGLAVPGMPLGSPGMEVPGQPADAFDVVLFQRDGTAAVFARFPAGAS